MSAILLFCQVLGDSDEPFSVKVDGGLTVGELKDLIKQKAQISMDANRLKLFKWNQPGDIDLDSSNVLNPMEEVKNIFSGDDSPKKKCIHIIVKVPEPCK